MAKSQPSIVVSQHFNPRYNTALGKNDDVNPEHNYKVDQTVNTLVVKIGEYCTPCYIQGLIDQGINVTVKPVSGGKR